MRAPALLIVDDDKDLLTVLKSRFEAKGYRVLTARDGDAALDLFRDRRPEVVLMDVRMPRLDGVAILREMTEVDPDANIVIMSGAVSPSQAKLVLDSGAREFIPKPLDLEALDAAVELLSLGSSRLRQ